MEVSDSEDACVGTPYDDHQNLFDYGFGHSDAVHLDEHDFPVEPHHADFLYDYDPPNLDSSPRLPSGVWTAAPRLQGPASALPAENGLGPDLTTSLGPLPKSQPTVPIHVHEATFARALLTNCSTTDIMLPWETPFYKEFFSDEPFCDPLVPEMPIGAMCSFGNEPEPQEIAQTVAAVAKFPEGAPVFAACVSSSDNGSFADAQSSLHGVAVQKLLTVLRHDLSSSETGRHILELGSEKEQMLGAHKIVEAVLGTRAPSTLVKRSNSLLSYLRWFDRMNRSDLAPFSEECIWLYFQQLRDSGAPCTKGSSALSAFRFAFHLLGFSSLGPALNSRRLVGICEIMLSQKRLLKQARVLTVAQVKGLHKMLRDTTLHLMDRAVIAYVLFALYGRCRNSDLLMIHSVEPDFDDAGGYVIIQTCNHKTGRLASLKSRLLPIVVPARGVDGLIWTGVALSVFEAAGVTLIAPIDGPLLHAPRGDPGLFMERGLKASEVSTMVRKFTRSPEPPVPAGELVSSHSLKATTLSWCARFGLSPAVRSLLGRHASSLNETYAIYSRDLACAPVAELQTVIDAIAEGSFSPDSQRSEFFRKQSTALERSEDDADPALGEDLEPCQTEPESNVSELLECSGGGIEAGDDLPVQENQEAREAASDDSSSSSDSEGEASSAESDEPEPAARVKRFRARIPEGQKWFVHSKSHLVHRHDGDVHNGMLFTVCGRRLNAAYFPCTEATAWNVLCKSCNRR